MQKGFSGIIIIGVIGLVVLLGIFLIYQNKKLVTSNEKQVNTKNLQNKEVFNFENTENIPILKDYDSKTMGRNLWLYSPDFKESIQLSFYNVIDGVYGRSPDSQKILVSTINTVPGDNNLNNRIGIVDIKTKEITRLFTSFNENSYLRNIYWLDNNNIIYSLGRQIKVYTISSGKEKILVNAEKSITDSTTIGFQISPDKKWLVYYFAGNGEGDLPQQDFSTYSFNLESGKQIRLLSKINYYAVNNNGILFTKQTDSGIEIWKSDFQSLKPEIVTKTDEKNYSVISTNDLGNKIIYSVSGDRTNKSSSELYLYDLETKKQTQVYTFVSDDTLRNIKMSPTGDWVLFSEAADNNHPLKFSLINLNLNTSQKFVLTNDKEHSESTVILY